MKSVHLPGVTIAPRGRSAWLAVAVALAVALSGAVLVSTASWSTVSLPWHRAALPDDVALEVGGSAVTITALDRRLSILSALYGVKEPSDPAQLDTFRRDAAKSMAVSLVIERAAAARGITVPETKAQSQLSSLVSSQLGGDRRAFATYLAAAGLSEADVLDEIRRTLLNQRLYEEVTKAVPAATSAQARQEYDTRRSAMRSPERRVLSNIVVSTRAQATKVIALLRSGRGFAQIARAVSLDAETKDAGGRLGAVTEEQLETPYAEAAFGARRGAVFGPVQTSSGWNVGRVDAVEAGRTLAFAEVERTLLESLTTEASLEVWRTYMREQLDAADVVYAPAYRPADPDALPSDVAEKDTP
ncbi:peptidylprolyl isomerase [Nocardioides sp. TRM66260-LWL]|uniref:peptidylprolyl isomerase n=1 Tax=Nocardioides sp. TRM66260-LWL TaxID=2874478 RepID=UPI001CC4877F|nr:peptidyl-prolyl cis-trans isomerase [Nocardioides sp. TRM66260-LWL]MBZ5735305.1 peptidylprolyl isomerase [Nocardioides sp. TRM66260-LWL]